jgi:putative flippase GtrA
MKWIDNIFDILEKYIPFVNRFRIITKYLFFSFIAVSVDIGLLYILTEFGNLYYLLSAILSYSAGILVNFAGQKKYTFKNNGRVLFQFASFVIISLIGLALNIGILKILVSYFSIWYIYAKIISIIIVFFWNFFANKNITFTKIK